MKNIEEIILEFPALRQHMEMFRQLRLSAKFMIGNSDNNIYTGVCTKKTILVAQITEKTISGETVNHIFTYIPTINN